MENKNRCENCGLEIRTMIFRGSGTCGDSCRKAKEENAK